MQAAQPGSCSGSSILPSEGSGGNRYGEAVATLIDGRVEPAGLRGPLDPDTLQILGYQPHDRIDIELQSLLQSLGRHEVAFEDN